MRITVQVLSFTCELRALRRFDQPKRLLLPCPQNNGTSLIDVLLGIARYCLNVYVELSRHQMPAHAWCSLCQACTGVGGHTDVKATEAGAVGGFRFHKCPQEMYGRRMRPHKKSDQLTDPVHENSRTWTDANPLKKHNFGQVLTTCKISLSHCTISC